MRTKADKGKGGSILADISRTSFMDDPIPVEDKDKDFKLQFPKTSVDLKCSSLCNS